MTRTTKLVVFPHPDANLCPMRQLTPKLERQPPPELMLVARERSGKVDGAPFAGGEILDRADPNMFRQLGSNFGSIPRVRRRAMRANGRRCDLAGRQHLLGSLDDSLDLLDPGDVLLGEVQSRHPGRRRRVSASGHAAFSSTASQAFQASRASR